MQDRGFNVAVWSYGYNADTALSAAVTDLNDEAEMLLDRIKGERSTASTKARQIIFVAHSLGGILVKKVRSDYLLTTLDQLLRVVLCRQ